MTHAHPLLRYALACVALVIGYTALWGQGCSLTINPRVWLALDQSGQALVDYDMVLEGTPTCAATLEVTVFNPNGGARSTPLITCADVGRSLRVTVRDRVSGVSASGRIDVSDNLRPTISAADVSVPCTVDPFSAADASVTASDNCTPTSGLRIETVSETISSVGCAAGVAQTITRVLVAIDAGGRVSAPVTQVITVTRVDLLTVSFPQNLTLSTSSTGLCPDELLALVPEGVPTAGGFALDASCKLLSTFTDVTLPSCGLSRKLLRTYTILDCCTNQLRRGTQIIQLLDDVAPTIGPLPDSLRAVPADNDCNYTAILPSINAMDDCDATVRVRIRTPYGILTTNGGTLPRSFPLTDAPFPAIYEVRDACGNLALDTIIIFAEDITPPVAICNNASVISITGEGTVVVARVFDAGTLVGATYVPASYDNCSPVTFSVRRDTLGPFRPSVRFGCGDIGQTVVVELQVTDEAGNSNRCRISAIVQSTIPPRITPPATFTASCLERPVDTSRSGAPLIFQTCPNFQVTGFADDNSQVNVCGAGFTIRTFTITDLLGATQTVTQRIDYVDTFTVVLPTLPDIELPCEATLDVSTLNPPTIGTPCMAYLRDPNPLVRTSPSDCGTVSLVEFRYSPMCGTEVITLTQRVTQVDLQAPSFVPSPGSLDLSVSCASELPANPPIPTAVDNCTGASVVLERDTTQRAGGNLCGNLTRILTYRAVDGCGNVSPSRFTVTLRVQNYTPPTIGVSTDTLSYECLGDIPPANPGLIARLSAGACGGEVSVTVGDDVPDDANTPCAGAITRVYTAVDVCGNSSIAVQRIEYRDQAGPLLAPIADGGTFECYADLPLPDNNLVAGTDACGNGFAVTGVITAAPTNSCLDTILRVYTAIDQCGNTSTASQRFFVRDRTAPGLTVPRDRNTFSEENACGRQINLTASAVDRCGSGPIRFTNDSPYSSNPSSASAAGFYPLDSTVVTFTATDACGNMSSGVTRIYVADIVSPSFRCSPVFVYLDAAGQVTVTDSTLLAGLQAADDCTPVAQLELDVMLSRRTFTCADVGNFFPFTLVATDRFGNSGACDNNIIVDDTLNCVAPLASFFAVRGRVVEPLYGRSAREAVVKVGHAQGELSYTTDEDGQFVLNRVPSGPLEITAEVGHPFGYGITSYDLLLANRHILGTSRLRDPLLLLAADVNGSGSVTGFDVTRMRRVLLGLDQDFGPGTKSTLALDARHVFSDPSRPWLDRSLWGVSPQLDGDLSDVELAVIKLGDLNPAQALRPRSGAELLLTDRDLVAGESVQIVLRNGGDALAGLQLALVAEGSLEVAAAEAEIDVLSHAVDAVHNVSVLSELLPGAPILEFNFKPARSGRLSDLLQLSGTLAAEGYGALDLAPTRLSLKFEAGHSTAARDLLAYPNPFANTLTLSFYVHQAGEYRYGITDLAGRSFAERRVTIAEDGRHNFVVATDHWAEGLYFLTVDGPDGRQTERLLLRR